MHNLIIILLCYCQHNDNTSTKSTTKTHAGNNNKSIFGYDQYVKAAATRTDIYQAPITLFGMAFLVQLTVCQEQVETRATRRYQQHSCLWVMVVVKNYFLKFVRIPFLITTPKRSYEVNFVKVKKYL